MRLGMMLRAIDEKGGIGLYTRNVVTELLSLDQRNHHVLFYSNPNNVGRFAAHPNVTEIVVPLVNKAQWDQVAIPWACQRAQVDLLFHPKFTAPLLAPCPVVMTVHGADWFMPGQAQYYGRMDVYYMRLLMPWYLRKCTAVISVSQLTTDNFYQVFKLPPGKMKTVYLGAARYFQRETDPERLQAVSCRYGLPGKFILTLTKRMGDDRKNLGRIFESYRHYHQRTADPYKLVVGGKDCHLFRQDYAIPDAGYGADILFPGWIDQADLPAVYSQAGLYLYPSNLEAFPVPITEAMACGTPIVTSNVNGMLEIAGDAAIFVNPGDAEEIATAVQRVLADPELQTELSGKGLSRSRFFSWEKCARETLAILTAVHENKWPRGV